MNLPRIKPLPLPLPENIQKIFNKIFPENIPSPNLYRTVAVNEGLFIDMVARKLIGPTGLFDRKTLAPRLREFIILRTCFAAKNDYEFYLHTDTISRAMGLTDRQIDDIRNKIPDPSLWNPGEVEVMGLVDSLVEKIEVSDQIYSSLKRYFEDPEIIEITYLIGLYTGVAMMVALARPEPDNYRELFSEKS